MSDIYFNLRDTTDQYLKNISQFKQRYDWWEIINELPTTLVLYLEKYQSGRPKFLTTIKPREKKEYPPNFFGNRDQLFTYFEYNKKYIPFLQPYMFREIWKTIRLGTAVYRSTDGHAQTQASNWDIRGIFLHNKIAMPLDIYYKGNLVAQISAYDGMNYMGGSSSSVYFDNNREGLNFGDTLIIKYSLSGIKGKTLYTILIDDEQCQSVNIGEISGGYRGPNPDNSIYKVNEPVFTGITYYIPIGGYKTIATNPFAPF